MATNRFDRPIESEYISQYTPIPFEQLYAIGKANNERVDKAYQELGNNFTKWAEFRSPSAVDTKKWYDLTVGAGQDVVNQLAANPDLIKTAEGRSLIQSFINSRPYDQLSQLQQSREGLLQRQKVNQQLMLNGKYNPLWHDVDFTNYDTSSAGVYNDIAPLAYKSEVDLVKPYVDNLKPGFIRSQGLYDYSGISSDRTDAELAKNMSAIFNTPEAQKHIETLQRTQGLTKEAAEQQFANTLITAGREFAYENRQANPYALINYKAAAAGAKPSEYDMQMPTPREKLSATIASGVDSNMKKMFGDSKWAKANNEMLEGIAKRYVKALKSGNKKEMEELTDLYAKVQSAVDFNTKQMIRKDFVDMYGNKIDFSNFDRNNVKADKFNKVSTDLLDKYSADIPASAINRFMSIQYGQPAKIKTVNGVKEGYVLDDSSRVLLPQYLVGSMLGIGESTDVPGVSKGLLSGIPDGALPNALNAVYSITNPLYAPTMLIDPPSFGSEKDDFVSSWRDGRFKNVAVIPMGKATTNITQDGKSEYVKVKVRIPMQSFTDAGYDTSIINTRNSRVKRDLNATVDEKGEAYEFIGYVPLNQDYQTAEEYNRASTNEWVGHTVGDPDRYHELEVESQRLK